MQNFQDGFPGVTRRFEWFAIDYTGRFWIETPGDYRFSLYSDDGADLSIDDRLVIDNDGHHPPGKVSGGVALSHGVHRIRVAYFRDRAFEVALILKIARPGQGSACSAPDDFKPPPDVSIDSHPTDDRVQIDNDFVRVIRAIVPPHEKPRVHEHPFNRVIVYLDKGSSRFDIRTAAWKSNIFQRDRRSGARRPGAASENTGRAPVRVVEIELKKPGPVFSVTRERSGPGGDRSQAQYSAV